MATTGTDPFNRPTDTGALHTGSETEAAKEKAEHLGDRAKEKVGDLKRRAGEAAGDMRDRARSAATDQKNAAAGRMEGVAHALRTASDDLQSQGQPMIAEYSRHVAEGLESMADSLGRRDVDDLVGSVEDFARARPVAFLGGAVVAGFALARFMKASSTRRYGRATASRADTAAAGMAGASMPGAGAAEASAAGASGQREQGGL
jgi:hypothetical protein